jgi:predicted ATPase
MGGAGQRIFTPGCFPLVNSTREVERRIQVVEDNLRQLQEQATALSGAADEERIANRIADQEAKLAALFKQREAAMRNLMGLR